MPMFNRNNIIAAFLGGLLIFIPMFAQALDELPILEGIHPGIVVEKLDEFDDGKGKVVFTYIVQGKTVCYTDLNTVEQETGGKLVSNGVFPHPVTDEPVMGFYFNFGNPRKMMLVYTASAGEAEACLNIIMILQDQA